MAVAGLVLGIIACASFFIPVWDAFAGVIGIVGIILSALGRKDPAKKGMATAGLVLSIIGTALCFIGFAACGGCAACAACASLASL